ncbi:MAG: hypothetical protein V4710_04205 [Verrucomicrobiota bacterium]
MLTSESSKRGSVLAVAMITLVVLAGIVTASYTTLLPRYRSVYQAASWQEAFHGAEAGLDVGINALNTFARSYGDPSLYPWATSGWTYSDAQRRYDTNGERTLNTLPTLGGSNNVAVSKIAIDVYTRDSSTSGGNIP